MATIDTRTFTITVAEHLLHKFDVKLRALNRKCKRLSLPSITVGERNTISTWVEDEDYLDGGYYLNKYEITITAPFVKVDGDWEVCGVIEPSPIEGKNFVNLAPNSNLKGNDYLTHDLRCDHCNTLRRRSKCVIIRSKDTVKVVGSTCLKSYTGISPEAALLPWDTENIFGEYGNSAGGEPHIKTITVIRHALSCIRVDKGYTSKADCYANESGETNGKVPTASTICTLLWGTDSYAKNLRTEYAPTDEDITKAASILEEWKSIDEATADDFTMKLLICAQAECLPAKQMAVVAGGCSGWLKRNARQAEWEKKNAEKAALPAPAFIGSVGEKVEVNVEVDAVRECDGYYGTSVMISGHVVGTRNKFTWFCSGNDYQGLSSDYLEPVAGEHKVRMTVKKHQDHPKYGKATIVVRVKAL